MTRQIEPTTRQIEPTTLQIETTTLQIETTTLGSSQPLLHPLLHPYIDPKKENIYLLTMTASLAITLLTTYAIYTHHFKNLHKPNLQRLSLRIASIPLVYSLLSTMASVYPPIFWLTSICTASYEGYALYNLLALMVLWAGGVESAKVECGR